MTYDEITCETLPSGLTLVMDPMPQVHSVAVCLVLAAGARDEAASDHGICHFIEHMCFKSTPQRTAEALNRELDRVAPDWNAATDLEYTQFHAWVPAERLERAVALMAELVFGHR